MHALLENYNTCRMAAVATDMVIKVYYIVDIVSDEGTYTTRALPHFLDTHEQNSDLTKRLGVEIGNLI